VTLGYYRQHINNLHCKNSIKNVIINEQNENQYILCNYRYTTDGNANYHQLLAINEVNGQLISI